MKFSCEIKENNLNTAIDLQEDIKYDPGDHVGIIACNRKDLVDSILMRLRDIDDYDQPLQLQLMKETHTSSGKKKKLMNPPIFIIRIQIIYSMGFIQVQ